MIEIIPAVMPKSFGDLRERIEEVDGLVSTVQIDVMDGEFVPEMSWPHGEEGNILEELSGDEMGLPNWENVDYEIDLMVRNPEQEIPGWIAVCASRIIVHLESLEDPKMSVTSIRSYLDTKRDSGECIKPLELGIALDIETPNDLLVDLLPLVDFVQFMGIARIGYQGEPFDDRVIPKIKSLRELFPEVIISIDGGVNKESIPKLVEAGANRLVAGSAIFRSDDIAVTVDGLRSLANSK